MTKTIFCKEVGRRIAAVRGQKHMTQQQVADAVGIITPYYSQIENGNKTASGYVLARIIETLETTGDFWIPAVKSWPLRRWIGKQPPAGVRQNPRRLRTPSPDYRKEWPSCGEKIRRKLPDPGTWRSC